MVFTIDRFEDKWAVVENSSGKFFHISKEVLHGFKEGDSFTIIKDEDETAKREDKIKKLADELFE